MPRRAIVNALFIALLALMVAANIIVWTTIAT